jgi:hypothetical protein
MSEPKTRTWFCEECGRMMQATETQERCEECALDDEKSEYPFADEVYELRGFADDHPYEHGHGGGDPDEDYE